MWLVRFVCFFLISISKSKERDGLQCCIELQAWRAFTFLVQALVDWPKGGREVVGLYTKTKNTFQWRAPISLFLSIYSCLLFFSLLLLLENRALNITWIQVFFESSRLPLLLPPLILPPLILPLLKLPLLLLSPLSHAPLPSTSPTLVIPKSHNFALSVNPRTGVHRTISNGLASAFSAWKSATSLAMCLLLPWVLRASLSLYL